LVWPQKKPGGPGAFLNREKNRRGEHRREQFKRKSRIGLRQKSKAA